MRLAPMFAGSNARWVLGWWLALGIWLPALHARAQDQFVLVDQTYTATTANTMDSHYRVDPLASAAKNWRAPIDYASGKVHARLDVMSKPSAKKTLYNICFEATPSYACMPYAMYTTTGVTEIEFAFSTFYQYNDVDWSKGVKDIALILKDENETKMQGSPDFYPTTIHVTLTVVKPGATYVAPVEMPDAGTPVDAGAAPDAAPPAPDAATAPDAARPAPVDAGRPPMPDAAQPTAGSAGMSGATAGSGGATAGTSGAPIMKPSASPPAAPSMMPAAGTGAAGAAAPLSPRKPPEALGGCTLSPGNASARLSWLLAALLLWWLRRASMRAVRSRE